MIKKKINKHHLEILRKQSLIEQRVYTSRLLGSDKSLVLHGGGNTSVKIIEKNLFGDDDEILYVKGSGIDLETIEVSGFSPVRGEYLRRLASLSKLSDIEMVNEFVTHQTKSLAPIPSVEAILHAIIPFTFVDHTHADAILTVMNSMDGEKRIREIYGNLVVVIPYVMPGFDLSRLCSKMFHAEYGLQTIGLVLMNHGIFSFGETAWESYERMIILVEMAEDYLKTKKAWGIRELEPSRAKAGILELALLRRDISSFSGYPMIVLNDAGPNALGFAQRADIKTIALQGPATPDHVIRTKRFPMIGRDVKSYVAEYQTYFAEYENKGRGRKLILNPTPRVVLDPVLGLCTTGRTVKEASIVEEIYQHTMDIIRNATALGGYRALSAADIFDVEYWDLEQAKVNKDSKLEVFSGEIAIVTGAASGIGKACVESLLKRGAAVVGVDLNSTIEILYNRTDYLGITCNLTNPDSVSQVLERTVKRFGGIDMLVLNAGIFPSGCRIENLQMKEWREVISINLDVNLELMRKCHPILKLAPRYGRVVVIGSKNVIAPGPGAAAYSASKAALNQLARVAALEWGNDNIRVNILHPNGVFDTGLWTDEVINSRAKYYELSVDDYKHKNILKTEVTSRDVAELAAELCGPLFAKTTGAQIPVDGGNERVI